MRLADIQIIKADITKLKVDVIVNAANKSLLGGGGVDGAIHRAAGPKLLEACKLLNGAETGEAKITEGYNLLAKKIIHTPGPRWLGGGKREAELLADCWRNSLNLTKEENLHTIAFPSISTGIYHFPLYQAALIAMNECVKFLNNNSSYDLEITIAAFDDRTKLAYKDALSEVLGQSISVNRELIENKSIDKIDTNQVFAFMFAFGGAMGTPGETNVYLNDGEIKVLSGNYAYGDLDIDSLMKQLGFDKIEWGMFGDASNIPNGWKYIGLGAGNNLMVRDYIFDYMQEKCENCDPSEIYGGFRNDIVVAERYAKGATTE